MISDVDVANHRTPDHDIMPPIWQRWSPRIMSGEPVGRDELHRLFEAARWAPSSYNRQPWRFVYATRDGRHWDAFFDLLVEGNQRWCAQAGALLIVACKTVDDDGNKTLTHSFDTGAAWQNLALQGCSMSLVMHGMQGFDYEQAHALAGFPDDHQVEAMVAVGHPGSLEDAPERTRDREKPSGRNPVAAFAFEGRYAAG